MTNRPTLEDLVAPSTTAVLTIELQRGVSGDLAMMPELHAELVDRGVIAAAATVCRTGRSAGVRVVHCTAVTRADGAGRLNNARILAATAKHQSLLEQGSPGAQVMPELEPADTDIEMARLHGLTPFIGTSLDRVLRNLGVTTVVIVGNSLNVGVLGAVIAAVDLGYHVVVATDAVAGVPADYADAVLANTVALLATLTTSDELAKSWRPL